MNNLMLTFSMPDVSRLRALVTTVDKEIALVAGGTAAQGGAPKTPLMTAWSSLVGMLDLGPEPEMRVCPSCKQSCMLEATRCGYCWASLPVLGTKEKAATSSPPG